MVYILYITLCVKILYRKKIKITRITEQKWWGTLTIIENKYQQNKDIKIYPNLGSRIEWTANHPRYVTGDSLCELKRKDMHVDKYILLRIAYVTVSKNVPKHKVCHKIQVWIKEIFWDILYYIIALFLLWYR